MTLASLSCRATRLAAFKIPCWPVALCRKTGLEAAALFSVRIASRRAFLPPALSVHAKDPSFAVPSGGLSSQHSVQASVDLIAMWLVLSRGRRFASSPPTGRLSVRGAAPIPIAPTNSVRSHC